MLDINSSFNKHKYMVLSCVFHLSIFCLLYLYSDFSIESESIDININTQGSKNINIVFQKNTTKVINEEDPIIKKPIIHEKGELKKTEEKTIKKEEEHLLSKQIVGVSGEYDDDSNAKSIIEDQSLLDYKAPIYPKKALQKNQQGEVIVRMLVDNVGNIKQVVIHKSSRYPLLDKAVLEVAKHWNIKRSLKDSVWVQVRVSFVLQ